MNIRVYAIIHRGLQELARRPLLVLIYFLVLSCWTIGPVVSNFSSCLPIRNHHARAVPIFNAWTIWWNSDRLSNGLFDYWKAPIFFPAPDAFAYSEPQPATMIVAPLVWLTRSPAVAYNTYLLMSLTLNGYVTFRVLRRMSCRFWTSLIGGSMIVWLPAGVREIEVLQLVPVWPIIWTWDSIRRYGSSGAPRTALEATLASVICFYSCIHHALFLALSILLTAWPLFRSLPSFRALVQTGFVLLVGIAMIGVVYFPMKRALDRDEFHRDNKLVQQLSASPQSLLTVPHDSWLADSKHTGKSHSPGWIKLSLAGMGFVLGLLHARRRRWALFLGVTILVCSALSNGPNLQVCGIQIWQFLGDWIPGIRQVRNVFRFVYFFQMAVILLAVVAIHELELRFRLRSRFKRWPEFLLGATALFALAEVPPPSISLVGLPNLAGPQGWAEFIRTRTPDGKGIACLPFPAGLGVADFDETVRWMYLGSMHGRPLVNGYSGFFPPESLKLNDLMSREGLSPETLSRLWLLKVHFIVVRRADSIAAKAETYSDDMYALQRVFRDAKGIDVYELVRAAASPQKSSVN